MENCIFCSIAAGKINSDKVYEDENVIAFNDINPEAPVHVLVIPKDHIASLNDVKDLNVISNIFSAIQKIAEKLGIDKSGYRVVNNCGDDGGQEVKHIHFHILGGRKLKWPPG